MKRRALSLLGFVVVLALATDAFARPGGGDSFSGGGGHGGGGGGGGDGGAIFELVYWIFRLIFEVPQLGLPILALVIGWVIYSAYKQQKNKDWDSGPPVQLKRAVPLEPLRRVDPDFSQVLFEDFAFRLFSTAQRARHSVDELALVAPYVSGAARLSLLQRLPGQRVRSVVVGALRTVRVEVPPAPVGENGQPLRTHIVLELEANVTTDQHTYYTVETWTFGRDAATRSKPPSKSRTFACPNCGAPWSSAGTGTQKCASCGEIVDNGRFDWLVEDIHLQSSDERPPTLTGETEERGTDLDTYRQPNIDAQWKSLETDDPSLTEQNLVARVAMIFHQLNTAWSNNELRPVRGLVSDGLYDYLSYWVDAYKSQKLRNQLTEVVISHTLVAKIIRDRWYDALTIRIWASGIDYVLNTDTGRVVRGSKMKRRSYSEYWTLIRSRSRKGAPIAQPNCSNCGAPLKINMAGECEHCNAHITAGEFDWVLSKIEQDDTYRG